MTKSSPPGCLQLRRPSVLCGAGLWRDSPSLLPLYRHYGPAVQCAEAGEVSIQVSRWGQQYEAVADLLKELR